MAAVVCNKNSVQYAVKLKIQCLALEEYLNVS